MEMLGLSGLESLLAVLGVAGVVSFGVVHVLKMLCKAFIMHTAKDDAEPWFWNPMLRGLAIVLGGAVGAMFSFAGLDAIVALGAGLVGGVMNTTIVAVVKSRIKAFGSQGADASGSSDND